MGEMAGFSNSSWYWMVRNNWRLEKKKKKKRIEKRFRKACALLLHCPKRAAAFHGSPQPEPKTNTTTENYTNRYQTSSSCL